MTLTPIFQVVKQFIKYKGQEFSWGPFEGASVKPAQTLRLGCHCNNPLFCVCNIHWGCVGDPQRKVCIMYVDEYDCEEHIVIRNVNVQWLPG